MPLIQLGLKVVPIDIELDTLNVSSKKLIEKLNKYPIKMLFLTNLLGFCGDIDEIKSICDKRKIICIPIFDLRKLPQISLSTYETAENYQVHHQQG